MRSALYTAIIAATIAAGLSGCSKKEAVEAAGEKEVRDFFAREEYPAPVSDLWKASILKDTLVCGRMEPVNGGDRHRFYYDFHSHHGQVEMAQVVTYSPMGSAILAQNRELFNKMWEDNCAEGEASLF